MKHVSVIYFSPTGGTRKACVALASALAAEMAADPAQEMTEGLSADGTKAVRETDLCKVDAKCSFGPEDVVIVGMPVFGGRIPAFGAEKLSHCHGNGAVAVSAVVYGNRAFEDALLELNDCLEKQGFRVAAGAALLAEHSMVREIAAGRPDEQDMGDIRVFAERIRNKLGKGSQEDSLKEDSKEDSRKADSKKENFQKEDSRRALKVPGNRPYRDWKQMPVTPLTGDACIACGECARECPTGAIPLDAPDTTKPETCILCMRCISLCPVRARQLPPQAVGMLAQKLLPVMDLRRENELFL